METYGRRALIASALIVMLGGASACSPAAQGKGSSTPLSGTLSSVAASKQLLRFCQVEMPSTWKSAFAQGKISTEPGQQITPMASSEDGRTVYVWSLTVKGNSVKNFVQEIVDGKLRRTVAELGKVEQPGTGVEVIYDGRWLVYPAYTSPNADGLSKLYVWDSKTGGAPRQIAENAIPVVYNGKVAWVDTRSGDAATRVLHLYDLASATDKPVRVGDPGSPFRIGRLLVWGESPAPNQLTKLMAVDFMSGAPAQLPPPIAGIAGAASISASDTGDTVAWIDSSNRLYLWRQGWTQPVEVRGVPNNDPLDWVHATSTVIAWSNTMSQYVLDLRTGAYTKVTPEGGGSNMTWGRWLVIGYPPTSKVSNDSGHTIVDSDALPELSGC